VQQTKGISKNRLKIEISIQIFEYSVEIDVRKKGKNQGGLQKCYSFAAVGLGKILAHCDG